MPGVDNASVRPCLPHGQALSQGGGRTVRQANRNLQLSRDSTFPIHFGPASGRRIAAPVRAHVGSPQVGAHAASSRSVHVVARHDGIIFRCSSVVCQVDISKIRNATRWWSMPFQHLIRRYGVIETSGRLIAPLCRFDVTIGIPCAIPSLVRRKERR